MSAEEADKTTTTDASAGDEEEEWLYGGKTKQHLLSSLSDRGTNQCVSCSVNDLLADNTVRYYEKSRELASMLS